MNISQNTMKHPRYEIHIKGRLQDGWEEWLNGNLKRLDEVGKITILTISVQDQAALRGILNRLWDLNLTILSVKETKGSDPMATDHTRKKEHTMAFQYILDIADPGSDLATVGGKGASLSRLFAASLPVPGGFHITTKAYRAFVSANVLYSQIQEALQSAIPDEPASLETASKTIRGLFDKAIIPPDLAQQIVEAYAGLPGRDPAVAVRSSATAEDLPQASFAGQHDTYLNVSGASAVLEAAKNCWSSLWTARAIGYRMGCAMDPGDASMAVVVQILVPAEAAGVMFTANPLNGKREELVISAAWGLGEAVVGGLVTPDHLVVNKELHQLLSRETADKSVMSVRTDTGTVEQPVPANLRQVPVLNDQAAVELAKIGSKIEDIYHMPMDIEWAQMDGEFAIVQARPITAMPAPQFTLPDEWKLPRGMYSAMRNNIVELMADPLTPLFATLGLSSVNRSLGNLMTAFFGKPGIIPEELIITVNDYAYYNGSLRPGPMLGIILNTVGILKRMFIGAVERWTDEGRPHYAAEVQAWEDKDWRALKSTELLAAVRELTEAAIDAYAALVSGVIPAAWISEAMFTITYDRLIKRHDDPAAPTYLMGFDSLPIQAEKSLYDLAAWVRTQPDLAAYILNVPSTQLAALLQADHPQAQVNTADWQAWQNCFADHLRQFGSTIYNLDFANPVPADDPAPLMETVKMFLREEGVNPHERQHASAERRETATAATLATLTGWRLKIFRSTLARAQRFAPLREDGLAEVGLSYPLLRQMLREIGHRFVAGGLIESVEDIFWLGEYEAVCAAERLDQGKALENIAELIPDRKACWEAMKKVAPPMMLPNKFLGVDILKLKEGRQSKQHGNVLKGVAASPGQVTAPACVVTSPADFAEMQPGDILVASITTPAWTPLFARAVGVITDIGGPLSHGSIVAREYGIPAVLGTSSATSRIQSGQRVTVDGSEGKVYLSTNE